MMKIVASLMTLDQLEGAKTRRDFIDSSGTKEKKKFICRHQICASFYVYTLSG